MHLLEIPNAAPVKTSVMSTADTCCDVISTFVVGMASVEVGGMEAEFNGDETGLSACAGRLDPSCC